MSKIELKEEIQKLLIEIDDEALLKEIYQMICKNAASYSLSPEQKVRIVQAQKEIKEGKVISNEEANRQAREWNYTAALKPKQMNNNLGLSDTDMKIILDLLQNEKAVEQAIVFGSRAKGNYRNGSDVDIALKGENLDFRTVAHLSYVLNEETPMPYRFDLLNYQTLNNDALKEHINRVGKEIYSVGK